MFIVYHWLYMAAVVYDNYFIILYKELSIMVKTLDVSKLASNQNMPHTIQGDKAYTGMIQDNAQITSLLKAYCNKYGFDSYIHHLISSHSTIRGGWSFNNSKGDLMLRIRDYINR